MIQLRHNNLLIIPDDVVEERRGIILSDFSKRRPTTGIVFKAGPETKEVKQGDRVIFEDNARSEYWINDKLFYFMHEGNILAILCGENTGTK